MYNADLPRRADLPTSGRLLRSTAAAAAVAMALLLAIVLPAEYGIDPTGIGRAFGLTQMGEIKKALVAEAAKERAPEDKAAPLATKPQAAATDAPTVKPVSTSATHTITVRLKPGQGAEIKLSMRKGATARYEWTTQGGPVNYDTHGDPTNAPKNFYHGYGKGRNSNGDKGTLEAAFDGTHGWFWRNRSGAEVTVTLKTSGDYAEIKRVL